MEERIAKIDLLFSSKGKCINKLASEAGTIDHITVSLQISSMTPSLGADFSLLEFNPSAKV